MVRMEELERRAYKDAHAAQFAKTRHFPALGHLSASGENVILLQDCSPVTAVVSPRDPPRASRVHAPDPFNQLFDSTPMLSEFRSAVLCKHTRAREGRDELGTPALVKPAKAPFVTKSASEAKAAIRHPCEYDYPTGFHKQSDRVPSRHEVTLQEEARNRAGHVWRNANATTAKKAIEVDYFMNSSLTPPLGRKAIKEIVARNPQVQRRPKP
ncbi:hypothetical protein ACHHYP_14821 [Achlya hypogyna]|uniref:Uncharacterized protein n=1 Tax=Achlya hypogyna TaxID=1202772 RepID=A0A1V9YCA9_ACHHY|nr:hypothetical protein ACHHYP_14821 [Achlya hypogyna]